MECFGWDTICERKTENKEQRKQKIPDRQNQLSSWIFIDFKKIITQICH